MFLIHSSSYPDRLILIVWFSVVSAHQHRFSHGGVLRNRKLGRGARPLSTKSPIHVVFKANRFKLKHKSLRASLNFTLIKYVITKYSKSYSVKVEQLSIQHDHIHILIRASRRKNFQYFFRVISGQRSIADVPFIS